MSPAKRNYQIRNIEKWVGKVVARIACHQIYDLMWNHMDEGFTVCEWTKKIIRMEEASKLEWFSYEDQQKIVSNPHYDECYYYSPEALELFAA